MSNKRFLPKKKKTSNDIKWTYRNRAATKQRNGHDVIPKGTGSTEQNCKQIEFSLHLPK